jgi:hypothetical protein
MIWMLGLLWGCAPDRYSECERTNELYCECWDQCRDAEYVAQSCGASTWLSAEDWACYNDAFEEVCEEIEIYDIDTPMEMCGL